MNIAIDGPAGAGKSTIAKMVARNLNIMYVDTGAIYRAVGLYMQRNGIDIENVEDVKSELKNCKISMEHVNGKQRVILCGEDVTDLIRSPSISMAASAVSAIGDVRKYLLKIQSELAKNNDVVMDGRDIGTVVLPNATVKIFITASVDIRAKRRYDELIEKDMEVKFNDILEDIKKRDYRDSKREVAPLKPAEDAIILDTSNLSIDGSVEAVIKIINEKIGE